MESFRATLTLKDVLGLYLALEALAADERVETFRDSLRAFLYERLSIADMEEPELLYKRLGGGVHSAPKSSETPARRLG